MVSERSAASTRFLPGAIGILGIGVLVAFVTAVAANAMSPAKLVFVLGGFALLIPTMVLKDPKAYWLFLLVLSIPFDISKWLSAWLVEPQTLIDLYGQPASGTTAISLYLTDVVLIAMLLPWLAQVCMRRQGLYFPKIGYIFVLYLAWALFVSLINAESSYLAMFEMCRQILYFLSFVYLINNITTRPQFRSVIYAVLLGFIIGTGTVIVFFYYGVGTASSMVAGLLRDQPVTSSESQGQSYKPGAKAAGSNENLTLHGGERRFGLESGIKRSQGMFAHPAVAAGLCGLILPVVLAYLIAARNNRDRILLFVVFASGVTALVLTFSRAGMLGGIAGILALFAVAGWSGLISRRVLVRGAVTLIVAGAVVGPLLLYYLTTRPETFSMRFYLFASALQGYAEHPFLGVGLNNSTGASQAARQEFIDLGIKMPKAESADNLYLVLLTEVGPLGFILFFAFFGKIVMIAFRAMREVALDLKPPLVGIVAGFASLAVQNFADDTLGSHAISALLWLFAALIIAIARPDERSSRPRYRALAVLRRGEEHGDALLRRRGGVTG